VGIEQSLGWRHYCVFYYEPNVIMFRRLLGTDPMTGRVKSKF